MEQVNFRDPTLASHRIYVGHLDKSVSDEVLDIKFSPYGKIVGILRKAPGYAFIQYDQPSSAQNAIKGENGEYIGGLQLLVKSAEMKKKGAEVANISNESTTEPESMNKKYFSEANEYYENNSIMSSNDLGAQNQCEIIVVSKDLT